VEGAQPLAGAAAGVAQRDVVLDHLVDPGPFTDERDVVVTDAAGHAASLRRTSAALITIHTHAEASFFPAEASFFPAEPSFFPAEASIFPAEASIFLTGLTSRVE
jgi:hypothetical protein